MARVYLEVHLGFRVKGLGFRVTYNLLSNCSYNLNISPIIIVTLDITGL